MLPAATDGGVTIPKNATAPAPTAAAPKATPAPTAPRVKLPGKRARVHVRKRTRTLINTPATVTPLPPAPKVVVGTNHAPPFAVRRSDGSWSGLTIELWRDIAHALKIDYELREMSFPELKAAIEGGTIDVAAAALTITAEREKIVDFTHPLYTSGLGVAVRYQTQDDSLFSVFGRLLSGDFLKLCGMLALAVVFAGALIWLVERRRNREQFGGGPVRGIGNGIWWSGVTMTSVGYGDKVPQTFVGRLIGLVWMFVGVILLAAFTGAISSALTVQQLEEHQITRASELQRAKVGTVGGTAGAVFLQMNGVGAREYPTLRAALAALVAREVTAVVSDAPILRWYAKRDFLHKVRVQPATIGRHDYGIALKNGSKLREPVNRVILETIVKATWQELVARHIGS